MIDRHQLLEALEQFRSGTLDVSAVLGLVESGGNTAELGYARLDLARQARCGFPEVILGQGKTAEWIVGTATRLNAAGQNCLVTRLPSDAAGPLLEALPLGEHDSVARTFWLPAGQPKSPVGRVVILTAGTGDLPVAREALVTAQALGTSAELIADVGVAGLHRLIAVLPRLTDADAVVVVAGMDGALPSVVGGLVACPVFAVPTSLGYGASFQGMAALLTMLNACSAGVAVVNIDGGFKGGYLAALVATRRSR